jgi:hypothetical protein
MKKLIKNSLLTALATVIYVTGVAWFMTNAEKGFFGDEKTIWVPIAMLLLFVVSAGVTGSLVLGQPVMLYLDGKKREAVKQLGLTLAWLLVILILIFIGLAIRN